MPCPLDCRNRAGKLEDVKAVIKAWLSIQERKGDKGLGFLNKSIRTLDRSDGVDVHSIQDLTIVSADQGGSGLFRAGLALLFWWCGTRGRAGTLGGDWGTRWVTQGFRVV